MTAKTSKTFALATVFAAASLLPALAQTVMPTPSNADRSAMMEAILKSTEVQEKLNGAAVSSVEYEGVSTEGHVLFEVDSETCDLDVAFTFDGTNYTMVSPVPACH